MGRRIIGWAPVAAVVVGVLALAVAPTATAGAGGSSQLVPDREFYRPGEVVHLAGDVYKSDRNWFGPYTVSIRPAAVAWEPGDHRPAGQHPADVTVGRLVVTRIDDMRVRAEVTFVLPKVTDGLYQVDYCGPDCSTRLGDLYESWFFVGTAPYVPSTVLPPPTVPPTTVATTRAAPVTTVATTSPVTTAAAGPDEVQAAAPVVATSVPGGSGGTTWWWLAVPAALAVAVGARRWGRSHRTVTVTGSGLDGAGRRGSHGVGGPGVARPDVAAGGDASDRSPLTALAPPPDRDQ